MTEVVRRCAADGCPNVLDGRAFAARFCSDVCRSRQWKTDHDYGRHDQAPERPRSRPRAVRKTKTIEVDASLHADLVSDAAGNGQRLREYVEMVITAWRDEYA